MNPLGWKREHQVALGAAALLGLALGLAFGYARDGHLEGFWDWLVTALNPNYPTYTGTGWAAFGALIATAVVYTAQLMRR